MHLRVIRRDADSAIDAALISGSARRPRPHWYAPRRQNTTPRTEGSRPAPALRNLNSQSRASRSPAGSAANKKAPGANTSRSPNRTSPNLKVPISNSTAPLPLTPCQPKTYMWRSGPPLRCRGRPRPPKGNRSPISAFCSEDSFPFVASSLFPIFIGSGWGTAFPSEDSLSYFSFS
jgi:hypothetical protein